ncbi:hypothetical protein CAP35_04045 [Chitinophagaceae bacterium IBVUCB1]|nr:hypothetical protein CAP35_04045 [Chitinophagaceae bacterium IBVUCB1]
MKNILIFAVYLLSVQIVTAQNLKWNKPCAPFKKETYSVSFSADGNKVFSGSECTPSWLRIFDLNNGNLLWDYQVDSSLLCIQGVKLSSNGTRAAAIEEMGNLLIFDYTTSPPALLNTIDLSVNFSFSVNFSPDNSKLAVGSSGKKLFIYHAASGAQLHSIDAHNNWVMCSDWTAQEKIITGGDDNAVKLWDTAGNFIRSFTGHTSWVYGVKMTPDGSHIVSGSKDKSIKIWNVATGALVRTLNGHTDEVRFIDISDDGSKIVSGSKDGTIRIWDFNTGSQLKSFSKAGSGTVFSVDFSPNGRYVAAGTASGDVQLWDLLFNTSITNIGNKYVNIYPNPCADMLQLYCKNAESITVLDATGKIHFLPISKTGDNFLITTTSLPTGNYWLRVIDNKQTSTTPFIKK